MREQMNLERAAAAGRLIDHYRGPNPRLEFADGWWAGRGAKILGALLALAAFSAAFPATLRAQTFQTVPSLSFTKAYTGADPLSQVIGVASTGANFSFTGTPQSLSGGNWLTIDNVGSCCQSTPFALTVNVHPDVTLAAGTYTGQIVLTASGNASTLTIPVTLSIESSGAFFDSQAGGLTYSMITSGKTPPAQALQIRNAGSGTLTWSASASTADGGAWLKLSAASGAAPAILNVSVVPGSLPGLGITPGTFDGQIVLQSSTGHVTVPVIFTVGPSVFNQVNPLNFTKLYTGGDPLSQAISVSSTGANFSFTGYTVSSTGGNWLTIDNVSSCCQSTPYVLTVNVHPAITLVAGTYMSEIILKSSYSAQSLVVPVTLTIAAPTATFFESSAGALTYSMVTAGDAPPAQPLQIRNAGAGTLTWTASASTSDGGAWLKLSATSGTAPATLNVSVIPANLPNLSLVAGTFVGQVVLQTSGDRVTVPVIFTVGTPIFNQINPLNFTKVYAGGDPLSQAIAVSSSGSNFSFTGYTVSSTGGNWLTIDNVSSCCQSTPFALSVNVHPDITLTEGTYSAEIVLKSSYYAEALVVPVTLTIASQSDTFFDALPGALTYSMVTGGNAPPPQPVQIRNGGAGTLTWTATATTADGGAWLTVSPASGTAPGILNVSVVPANLPGTGLIADTFTGEVVLQTSGDRVTIPVSFTVGASVFNQVNPINFTKVAQGSDPLPQPITLSSTGSNFSFTGYVVNSTGGNWLTIDNVSSCCQSTPYALTVSAHPAVTLAAGTYTAEIVLKSSYYSDPLVVPVTLTVADPATTFLDSLPGGLTYSMTPGGTTPPSQPLPIRNAGTGTLNWTASATTSDGGAWLKVSAASGNAPATLNVSVVPANLPHQGLVAGTFDGEVVLQTSGDRVTVPVSFTVGASVFDQVSALSFSAPMGGPDPVSQSITVASTGSNFSFTGFSATATGGNWLTITNVSSCCQSTPYVITVSANPAATLAGGVYSGEIVLKSSYSAEAMIVPVSLTINGTGAAATPVFNPPGGTYTTAQSVVITDATPDSTIYYTTDGSTPTTSSTRYSQPIPVATSETIKAIATAAGFSQSAVGTASYIISGPTAATPGVSQTITITETTPGAVVHYTTDGSTPTASSPIYSTPLVLNASSVLKFIAIAPNLAPSAVRTVSTTIH